MLRLLKGDAEFSKIMAQVDPGHSGVVTFGAFIDYMAKETAEQDTLEQILQSFRILCQDRVCILFENSIFCYWENRNRN